MLLADRGYKKHQGFGLRSEWVISYLMDSQYADNLGVRQRESLDAWLLTTGLESTDGRRTPLFELFTIRGVEDPYPWKFLWINVVFNFPTATWYVWRCQNGSWTIRELVSLLHNDVPRLQLRTAKDAVVEIVDLLEKTPVGKKLGQGIVVRGPKSGRLVHRVGLNGEIEDEVIMYCLNRLFEREKTQRLLFSQELLWPWTIFQLPKDQVLASLILSQHAGYEVDEKGVYSVTGRYSQ